jgi:fatty-acyl-CoA synthase
MDTTTHTPAMSVVHGIPLADEPGLGPLTIPGYLRELTSRYADREALVMRTPSGTERWTYATLWNRSVEVAQALIAAGVGKGGRVGILMSNRLEFLACVFGTALAGGVTVALSTFSTPPELEYLLQASAVSILLFERQVVKQDFSAMLAQFESQIATAAPSQFSSTKFPFLRRLIVLGSVTNEAAEAATGAIERWSDFLANGRKIPPALVDSRAATVTQADAGLLFFSSGTTSLPKGILHAQRAVAVQWWRWPRIMSVTVPIRSWTGNGFFWSANISMVVGTALSTGGAVILQPVFQADEALDLMEAERVTMPVGRPHQWARLQESPRWATADLSSLHYVTYGTRLRTHPTVKTDWVLCNAFGTTETLTIMTSYPSSTPADVRGESHGEPLPGNVLKIVDAATGAVVPRGQRGEIAIKGPTLMLGYLGKPLDETLDDEGFFHTGDGGYVDEKGRLFWEGRLNDMIKTGGANVSPLEVDDILATYPGVKRTQTVGVPHDTLSEMVVACIVPHDGVTLSEAPIRDYLKAHLASFKVPRALLFFREEEFAVTGSEKVKIAALRTLATERLKEVVV